jgi:hypothetical protein
MNDLDFVALVRSAVLFFILSLKAFAFVMLSKAIKAKNFGALRVTFVAILLFFVGKFWVGALITVYGSLHGRNRLRFPELALAAAAAAARSWAAW